VLLQFSRIIIISITMRTRKDTTIKHVTGLTEERLEYKSCSFIFRFRRTIHIMSMYYFLIIARTQNMAQYYVRHQEEV